MAWMSDEKYEFIEDVREKRFTARSARNKKGHTGKGGAMRTASDFMSKKERDSLHGECKTYKLGAPMSWDVFCEMPNDLKAMYIKSLRKKFNVPDGELVVAMDTDIFAFTECLKVIKLKPQPWGTDSCNWYDTEDYERFVTWWVIEEE